MRGERVAKEKSAVCVRSKLVHSHKSRLSGKYHIRIRLSLSLFDAKSQNLRTWWRKAFVFKEIPRRHHHHSTSVVVAADDELEHHESLDEQTTDATKAAALIVRRCYGSIVLLHSPFA